jgi:hypothetical protein
MRAMILQLLIPVNHVLEAARHVFPLRRCVMTGAKSKMRGPACASTMLAMAVSGDDSAYAQLSSNGQIPSVNGLGQQKFTMLHNDFFACCTAQEN